MAADLIMPTLPNHQAQVQSHYFATALDRPHPSHTRSQSHQQPPTTTAFYSRQVSPLSSGQGSPTSPGSGEATAGGPGGTGAGRTHGARHNRPLFMPAVLRPTEYPSKLPRSPRNEDGPETDDLTLRRTSSSFISLPSLTMLGARLSRRSTGDSGKGFVDADLDQDLFPHVNGQPTRKHWKPDPRASVCDEPTCRRSFSYFNRRHHCRKCGDIFCDPHSAFAIPLDQDCNFNPRGPPSRSCGHCFSEFIAWKSRNNSRASSDQGSAIDAPTSANSAAARVTSKSTPASPINAGSPTTGAGADAGHEAAASVPRDWNWSTF